MTNCEKDFFTTYNRAADAVGFCPYRVCPLGAHVDHQLGKVTGMALDKGIHFAFSPKRNGIIELRSLNFEKRAQFHLRSIPEQKTDDWADYMRGVTLFLQEGYTLHTGLAGVFEGDLPIGGLSSSAAVTLVYLSALCQVNGISLNSMEMLQLAKAAENRYVGVSSGKLDQSCELLCKKNQLLYLDTKDDTYELIPESASMPPWKVAIFFSGLERTLVGSPFNMRVDECRAAGYAIAAFAGGNLGRFNEMSLRDIPREEFDKYSMRLPENWRRRALHYYSEQERVEQGVLAWRNGNLSEFGELMFRSCASSINNYETGSPELKALYEIMRSVPGIYGGRFSGAGFKGCCVALVNPECVDDIGAAVSEKYLAAFPAMKGHYKAVFCDTADGLEERGRRG